MKKCIEFTVKKISYVVLLCMFRTIQNPFSGKWVLNSPESTLGEQFSFAPSVVTITQDKNTLSYERVVNMMGEDRTQTSKFTLDGKECSNPGFRDSEVKSTANWSADGKVLTINSKVDMGGNEMTITEKYSKNAAGKLVIDHTMNGQMGEMTEKWVFDKK